MLGQEIQKQEFAAHNHPGRTYPKLRSANAITVASVSHLPMELLGDIYAKLIAV